MAHDLEFGDVIDGIRERLKQSLVDRDEVSSMPLPQPPRKDQTEMPNRIPPQSHRSVTDTFVEGPRRGVTAPAQCSSERSSLSKTCWRLESCSSLDKKPSMIRRIIIRSTGAVT